MVKRSEKKNCLPNEPQILHAPQVRNDVHAMSSPSGGVLSILVRMHH